MKKLIFTLLALAVLPRAGAAALTLPAVLAAARAENPDLAAARRRLALLDAGVAAAAAYPNPAMEFESAVSGPDGYELKAVQPLPLTRRSGRAGAAAVAEYEAGHKEAEALETRVLAAARRAWYALHIAGQRRSFEATHLNSSMDILAKIEQRVQAGEAGNADLARARVEAARGRLHLQEAQARAAAAAAELNGLLGRVPEAPLEAEAAGDFSLTPAAAEPAPLEKYTELALARRAEPRALALGVRSADLALELERDRRLPVPELGLIRGSDGGAGYTKLFLGLELPLWYNNGGEIKKAQARRAAAGDAERRLELEIRREVHSAWLALGLARQRLLSARETVTLLNDLRRSASQDYLSGRTGLAEFYETNRLFLEENLSYLDALEDYYDRTAQLDAAVNAAEAK